MLTLALYQPDIPQNVGAAIRLCACLGVTLDIIEPCGFPWDERKIRQAALDYISLVDITKYQSWESFISIIGQRRIILLTTKADGSYTDFSFRPDDIILMGRESAGVPDNVHDAVHAQVTIPLHGPARSLNVINAAAMALGEALRQTKNP